MDSPSARTTMAVGTEGARGSLRNLLLKLSLKYHKLPRALFLQDVQCNQDSWSAGSFADIHRGTHQGVPVALKRLRIFRNTAWEKELKPDIINAFHHECLVWRSLSHEHVLPILGVDDQMFNGELCMVMPWMEHGNIRNVIDDMQERGTPEEQLPRIHEWMKQIALGLAYLHGEGIAHGDLRGHNILIDANMHARISDFGLAVFADTASRSFGSARGGNVRWLAPEIMDPNQATKESSRPTFAADVYSFACVCVELYEPHALFRHHGDFYVVGHVLDGNRPDRPWFRSKILMGDRLWDVLSKCWAANPAERLTISEVLERFDEDVGVWESSPEEPPDVTVYTPEPPKYFENRRKLVLERAAQAEELLQKERGVDESARPLSSSPNAGVGLKEFKLAYVVLGIVLACAVPYFLA